MIPVETLTVRAHEVDKGDYLLGCATPVDMVLYHGGDGRWLYTNAAGTILRAVHSLAVVQVVRGIPIDECDPHGITRPDDQLFGPRRLGARPMKHWSCNCPDGDCPDCAAITILTGEGPNRCPNCRVGAIPGTNHWPDITHRCIWCGTVLRLEQPGYVAVYVTDDQVVDIEGRTVGTIGHDDTNDAEFVELAINDTDDHERWTNPPRPIPAP